MPLGNLLIVENSEQHMEEKKQVMLDIAIFYQLTTEKDMK